MAKPAEVTQLLIQLNSGDHTTINKLFTLIYDELHQLAAYKKRYERPDHTLNTTALVHEAYLKLVDQTQISWKDRHHFFRIAAEVMRRILIDYARQYRAEKRGGGQPKLSLDEALGLTDEYSAELIALDDSLKLMETFDKRQSEIVKMKYFIGFSISEIAENLNISIATVKREWQTAKSWLSREIKQALA